MISHIVMMKLPITVTRSCGLLNHLNSFHGGMFKVNTKSDTDSLLYLLSHFECNSHTVHMLTQGLVLPPLTSTVKSSVFTHVHSRPLSLAARLHWCGANHSCYINSGWSFSGQTLYVWTVFGFRDLYLSKHRQWISRNVFSTFNDKIWASYMESCQQRNQENFLCNNDFSKTKCMYKNELRNIVLENPEKLCVKFKILWRKANKLKIHFCYKNTSINIKIDC